MQARSELPPFLLADRHDVEADPGKGVGIQKVATVEDKGRLLHAFEDLLEIEVLKGRPLRQHHQGVCALGRLVRIPLIGHILIDALQVLPGILQGLRVHDAQPGPLFEQPLADVDRRCVPRIARIRLEGKPEHRDSLVRDGVKHLFDDVVHEPALLILVEPHHGLPVVGHFMKPVAATKVDEAQNVLLKAGPPEPDTCPQEVLPDARIHSDRSGYLVDVRTGLFTQGRDAVDRRDALRKERVGRQLGKLTAPGVGLHDPVSLDPPGIHVGQDTASLLPGRGLPRTDQDSIRFLQIPDGRALRQEFRIGKDFDRSSPRSPRSRKCVRWLPPSGQEPYSSRPRSSRTVHAAGSCGPSSRRIACPRRIPPRIQKPLSGCSHRQRSCRPVRFPPGCPLKRRGSCRASA